MHNPVLCLVVTSLCWSLGGVLIKLVDWNPFAIAGVRSLIAMLFLCIVNRRMPRFILKTKVSSGEKPSVDKKGTFDVLMGGILYAATMLLFVVATKKTTAANAIFLQYTSLIYLILFGPLLLKEKNTAVDYVTVAGLFVGMFVLIGGDFSGGSMAGNLLALGSGLNYGFSSIFLRRQKDADPVDSLILANFFCFIVTILSIIYAGIPSGKSCIGLLILGVVQIGLSSYFWGMGIKKSSAITVAVIGMLEPILNPVWVALAIKEIPAWTTVIGGLIILGFIVMHVVVSNKTQAKKLKQ